MVSIITDREKLIEKTGFTVANSYRFLYWSLLALVTVGLDNNLNTPLLSLPLASDFFATDFKNQTKVCIASRLVSTVQIEVWQHPFFSYTFSTSSVVCSAFVQGILKCFAECQYLVSRVRKKRMPAVNTALAKNGARPANIGCSSLSALVLGWTSPINL